MGDNYDRIARFYDVDMARNMAFDDVGFYAGICRRKGGRALELGCGNGRIFIPLLRSGIEAVGVDASAAMLRELSAKAQQQSLLARVCRMDVRSLGFQGAFDVVLCPYSLVTYVTTDDDLARMLREVRAVLRPGGLFVVDAFVPRPLVEYTDFRPDYRRPFGDHTLARSKRVTRLDAARNRIERRYQVVSANGEVLDQVDITEAIRPLAPDELTARLVAAGFSIDETWWDYQSTQGGESAQFFTAITRREP